MQTTGNIAFTAFPVTNLSFITSCSAINEIINFKVDNDPVQTCIGIFTGNLDNTYITIDCGTPQFAIFGGGFTAAAGTYTSGFTVAFYNIPNGISANTPGNNFILQISNFGPVGGYIDFTLNGTFENGTRTITATGHVLRDY
ncbi:hypothetical protein ACFQH0_12875 [Frigoriflavimonas asaccharolytica]